MYLSWLMCRGTEFLPGLIVPYNIPKKEDVAFLTCSYLSGENADYKTYPFEKLESELPGLGYTQIITIVSKGVVFPILHIVFSLNSDILNEKLSKNQIKPEGVLG